MALTVEDGSGLANADAYVSASAVAIYWTARADATFSTAAPEAQDAAVLRATQFVDVVYGERLKGCRASTAQALEFPREGDTALPLRLIQAVCELSKMALMGPLAGAGATSQAPSQGQIASMKAGSVEIAYRETNKSALEEGHGDKFYLVERILAPLLKGSSLNRGTSR